MSKTSDPDSPSPGGARPDAADYWDMRYRTEGWSDEPSEWLLANADLLPEPGRALDIAGGTGRNAIWLAQHGWRVAIVDVSAQGLAMARDRARSLGVDAEIETIRADLSTDPLPPGPFDLVLLFHYLDRALFPQLPGVMAPRGLFIGSIATVRNLERHDRPPRDFLLDEGELPTLLPEPLELIRYHEGWQDDRHEARFVARKPSRP